MGPKFRTGWSISSFFLSSAWFVSVIRWSVLLHNPYWLNKFRFYRVFVIDQLDVTILISLFTLYMFRTILVHHQEICYVWHAGLTKVCGVLVG
jgi:hypothetical protein